MIEGKKKEQIRRIKGSLGARHFGGWWMQLHVGRALVQTGIHYFLCTTELLHIPVATIFYSFLLLRLPQFV